MQDNDLITFLFDIQLQVLNANVLASKQQCKLKLHFYYSLKTGNVTQGMTIRGVGKVKIKYIFRGSTKSFAF